MRLVCERAVLDDVESHAHLDRLLDPLSRGWHVLIVDLAELRATRWYRDLGRRQQELVDRNAMTWAYQQRRPARGPHRFEVEVTPATVPHQDRGDDRWQLPAAVSADVAARPVQVFVENALSDGEFVKLAVDRLLQDVPDAKLDDAWTIAHGGGIQDLKRLVLRAAADAAAAQRPARCVAIFDSDRRHPDDDEGGARASSDCEAALTARGIPCLRLRTRTLENCIPNRALVTWAHSRSQQTFRQAQAFCELPPDARDHFPAEGGFATVARWPPPARDLQFHATTQQQRRLLAQGIAHIKRTDPSTQRPEVLDPVHWQDVTAADLRGRLGADAEALLDLILRFL